MSLGRFALFMSLDALLRGAPCSGMRKKAALAIVDHLRSELKSAVKTDDAATMQVVEDVVEQAMVGAHNFEEWNCDDVTSSLLGSLGLLDNFLFDSTMEPLMQDISSTLATVVMALDEKHCLKEAMRNSTVQSRVNDVNSHRARFLAEGTAEVNARMQLAFSRLVSWQEALVALGNEMLDRSELYPRNVNSFNCPPPCTVCTFEHGGLFKEAEKDKFKCILHSENKDNPPSNGNSRFACDVPKRRTFKFWEFKTWCAVPGWVLDAYQNARISAMVTCGMNSLLGTLKANAVMSQEHLQTCMLVEQRMVVNMDELTAYREFMATEDDGVVPLATQHSFGAFLTLATADGLVGLRDNANELPPAADERWTDLLLGGSYTLLPPALVDSVPCNPPINNWEVFVGGFAAVAGIGASTMLAALASIPLVLLTGFFFVLAGVVFLGEVVYSLENYGPTRPGHIALEVAKIGLLTSALIPDLFVNVFAQTSTAVYNALVPEKTVKPCPRGLLFLPGSEPICLADMAKLEAKRYACPQDESRSIVISCEPEFNGVIALRGSPC